MQSKFKLDDVFNDDYATPAETSIYYSKANAGGLIIIGLAMIGGAAYIYLDKSGTWLAALLGAIGVFLCISGYRHFANRNAQITLSNEGVQTAGTPFYPWRHVTDEDTVVVRHGKSSTTYFKFYGPDGEVKVDIGELAVRKSEFERLLRLYRGRYQQKYPEYTRTPFHADEFSAFS